MKTKVGIKYSLLGVVYSDPKMTTAHAHGLKIKSKKIIPIFRLSSLFVLFFSVSMHAYFALSH